MRFLFRTDANSTIGTGHLMRCLALASALVSDGSECVFLCRTAGLGGLAERIVEAGHKLLLLSESHASQDSDGPPHAGWLPGGQAYDAAACIDKLAGWQSVDWVVVDHYALDYRWESAMRRISRRIMVIDDLADRQHACDLLLDQNLVSGMGERYKAIIPSRCLCLLGPKYALLRPDFARVKPSFSKNKTERGLRVLIMFGGADAADLTSRSLEALIRMGWKGQIDVVAGPLYLHHDRLGSLLANLPQAILHAPARDVAGLMRKSDVMLGSPGVSSWERCACGLPSVVVAQADNQEAIGLALATVGANRYIGRAEVVQVGCIENELMELTSKPERLQAMAMTAAKICDGLGVERVVLQVRELS